MTPKPGAPPLVVMAPHGGGIEPGTVDVAHAVAGPEHSFYAFKGIKPKGNAVLHITSNRFDEPRALRMARRAEWVLTIHGCQEAEAVVFVGGRDVQRRARIRNALQDAGFCAEESLRPGLRGINPNNICNRGYSGRGVQLELSDGLRRQMFDNLKRRRGRRKTDLFYRFTGTLRNCVAPMTSPLDLSSRPEALLPVDWGVAAVQADRLKALTVRAIVFMEEQSIPFDLEIDAFEGQALHILGQLDGEPVAAARLRFVDGWAKLERIAVRRAFRGRRLAHELIDFMIRVAAARGYRRCRLHAQAHLCDLYRGHGFEACGNAFMEAGIQHVLMVRETQTP